MAEDDFVLETPLVQPFGLRHTRTFGDVQATYTIKQTAGMTRTRHYSSTGPATYNAIPGTNKRTRKVNGGTAVWTSGVYLSDAPSGSALSIRDFGDVSKKVIDVTSVGDTNLSGNLTAGQGSTITTSNLVFGSGSRLDGADFEELVISPGYATPTRVQVKKTSGSSVSTLTAAAWSPATVVNHLLVMLVNWSGSISITTPPSGWTQANFALHNGSIGGTVLYYKVAAGSDAAPAITLSGSTSIDIITAEYSGLLTASPLDITTNKWGSSTAPNVTSAVTTQTFELAIGAIGTEAGGVQSAATGDFTLVDQIGSAESVALLERVLTSKAQVIPADTLTSSSTWAAQVATFKAATGTVATPASGKVRIYAKTGPLLVWKDSAGVEYSLATLQKRTLYIPASQFKLNTATATSLGAGDDAIQAIAYANGSTQSANVSWVMPLDAVTGGYTWRPIWAPGSTDGTAHSVVWKWGNLICTGIDVTNGSSSSGLVGDSAARTANVQVVETGADAGNTPTAGAQIKSYVARYGGDASDTYVGVVNLLGVRIDYTSTV